MTLDDLLQLLTVLGVIIAAASYAAVHYKRESNNNSAAIRKETERMHEENRLAMAGLLETVERERDECREHLERQDKRLAAQDEALAVLREQVTQVAAVDRMAASMDTYYGRLVRQLDQIQRSIERPGPAVRS